MFPHFKMYGNAGDCQPQNWYKSQVLLEQLFTHCVNKRTLSFAAIPPKPPIHIIPY